jgi:integrase/recombinase XerD
VIRVKAVKGSRQDLLPLSRDVGAVIASYLRRDREWYEPEAKHVRIACGTCPSLKKKRVTPHILRQSLAKTPLQAGIDCSVMALWLGHESFETTQIYVDADLALKEKLLAKTTQGEQRPRLFKPEDRLLAF